MRIGPKSRPKAVQEGERSGRGEPGERTAAPEHRIAHERVAIDGEVERLTRSAVGERQAIGIAVDHPRYALDRVERHEPRVL